DPRSGGSGPAATARAATRVHHADGRRRRVGAGDHAGGWAQDPCHDEVLPGPDGVAACRCRGTPGRAAAARARDGSVGSICALMQAFSSVEYFTTDLHLFGAVLRPETVRLGWRSQRRLIVRGAQVAAQIALGYK